MTARGRLRRRPPAPPPPPKPARPLAPWAWTRGGRPPARRGRRRPGATRDLFGGEVFIRRPPADPPNRGWGPGGGRGPAGRPPVLLGPRPLRRRRPAPAAPPPPPPPTRPPRSPDASARAEEAAARPVAVSPPSTRGPGAQEPSAGKGGEPRKGGGRAGTRSVAEPPPGPLAQVNSQTPPLPAVFGLELDGLLPRATTTASPLVLATFSPSSLIRRPDLLAREDGESLGHGGRGEWGSRGVADRQPLPSPGARAGPWREGLATTTSVPVYSTDFFPSAAAALTVPAAVDAHSQSGAQRRPPRVGPSPTPLGAPPPPYERFDNTLRGSPASKGP